MEESEGKGATIRATIRAGIAEKPRKSPVFFQASGARID
jgi:hypothetical protein